MSIGYWDWRLEEGQTETATKRPLDSTWTLVVSTSALTCDLFNYQLSVNFIWFFKNQKWVLFGWHFGSVRLVRFWWDCKKFIQTLDCLLLSSNMFWWLSGLWLTVFKLTNSQRLVQLNFRLAKHLYIFKSISINNKE